MSGDAKQLIETLKSDCKVLRVASCPYKTSYSWSIFLVFYILLMLLVFGTRVDIYEKLLSLPFVTEILTLLFVAISSSISAIFLSFPDMCQKRSLVVMPVFFILLLMVAMTFQYLQGENIDSTPVSGFECLFCIAAFSTVPAVLLFSMIRSNATTHCCISGMIAFISAAATGALILRLSESVDSISHIVMWHYVPFIGFAVIGMLLGKKLFRW